MASRNCSFPELNRLLLAFLLISTYGPHNLFTKIALSLPSPNKAFSLFDTQGGPKMEVGFFETFSKIYHHCWLEWETNGPTRTFLLDFINELSIYGFISTYDIFLCVALGVVFTILRYLLNIAVFKVGLYAFFRFFPNRDYKISFRGILAVYRCNLIISQRAWNSGCESVNIHQI